MLQNTTDLLNQLNVTQALYEKFEADEEQKLDKKLIDKALAEVYKRGDKVMVGFVGLHFLLALCFAYAYGTWLTSFVIGASALVSFLLAVRYRPQTFFTRAWAGIVLQAFVLLYIFQLKGLAEVRFFFFTSFVILIVYQDWRAMWPSVMLFFGQMLAFAYMGKYVSALPFFTKDYQEFILRLIPRVAGTTTIDVQAFWLYVGVSCLQVALAGLWAYFLRLNTVREVKNEQILLQKQEEIEKTNLDLEKKVKYKTLDLTEALENAQTAEEELRQNMEELQATQDEIEAQRLRLLANQEEMMKVDAELRERQKLMERSQWLESNLSNFDDLMRQYYDKSLEEFSDAIMLRLAELLKATQGVFYVYEETDDALYMTAGYACTPQSVKKNSFKAGEGLVGQLVKTKKMQRLENLPAESISVETALARIHSKTVVLVPMLYNMDMQGVIEMASLKDIDDLHLEFLQRLARNVATMLQSIRGIMRTQKLLEQSQEIAKQLQANALELEKTQEEAQQREQELSSQFEAINHAMVVLEYTIDGHILSVNENFERISGYREEELVGKSHTIFLAERYVSSEEYKQTWYKVRNNDFAESEYEGVSKNGQVFWLHTHYYALGEGRAKKIRVLAHDATKEKEQERKIVEQLKMMQASEELMHQQFETLQNLQEENERKTLQLQDQLNALNLSTALAEYDAQGKVLFVNERFCEVMGYEEHELLGQLHKDLVLTRFAESRAYDILWNRLLNKEFIEGDFEFASKTQQTVWLRGNYYPVTDKRGKITKIMHLATDITEEMKQDERVKTRLHELEGLKGQLTTQNQRLDAFTKAFQAHLATIELSPDGEILAVNDKFCEKICLSRKELVGKHHRHLFDEAFLASDAYRTLWARLHRGEPVELHHHGLHLAYQPLKDDKGTIARILGIVLGC